MKHMATVLVLGLLVATTGCSQGKDASVVPPPGSYPQLADQAQPAPRTWRKSPADTGASYTASAVPNTLMIVGVVADNAEIDAEDGRAFNAVDGDAGTFWHTRWSTDKTPCPHEITLQLSAPINLTGLTYLPRQDGGCNGTIKDYEIYVSDDGTQFGEAVVKGAFSEDMALKTVLVPEKKCRFVKLRALSEVGNHDWTSVAEIGIKTPDGVVAPFPVPESER